MADNNQQNNQQNAPAEDVGRLRQVRRDKLSELQATGRDPFQIVKYDQTHHTKQVRDNFESRCLHFYLIHRVSRRTKKAADEAVFIVLRGVETINSF